MRTIQKMTMMIGSLFASAALAGGGGVGPDITFKERVLCQPLDSNSQGIVEVLYFSKIESQWGNKSVDQGFLVTGETFEASIYSTEGDLHHITRPGQKPESMNPGQDFFAAGFNVRSLKVTAKGDQIVLSMVAGATGDVVVQNLKLICNR